MAIKISVQGDGFGLDREITAVQAAHVLAFIISEQQPEEMSRVAGSKGKARKSRRAAGSTSSGPRVGEAIKAIRMFTPELEGYPDYHSISRKGARILWVLAFAQANGVEELSTSEISFIATKLRDKIETKAIGALTVNDAKESRVTMAGSSYVLLHKGDLYLKGLTREQTDGA